MGSHGARLEKDLGARQLGSSLQEGLDSCEPFLVTPQLFCLLTRLVQAGVQSERDALLEEGCVHMRDQGFLGKRLGCFSRKGEMLISPPNLGVWSMAPAQHPGVSV